MKRIMCGVRLVDKVSSDVLRGRVGVVKIEDTLLHSRLRWYGHVIRRDTNSEIHEVLKLRLVKKENRSAKEITGRMCGIDLAAFRLKH